ncbi:MAG: hypothetical protein MR033_05650 [Clostridiales bacterium]|nr:hypothetical protein [Clostridiales bacterium]
MPGKNAALTRGGPEHGRRAASIMAALLDNPEKRAEALGPEIGPGAV